MEGRFRFWNWTITTVMSYRVFYQLADMAWVDLDLRCSILLPNSSAISAKMLSDSGTQRSSKIKVNPTKVPELMKHPVLFIIDC